MFPNPRLIIGSIRERRLECLSEMSPHPPKLHIQLLKTTK